MEKNKKPMQIKKIQLYLCHLRDIEECQISITQIHKQITINWKAFLESINIHIALKVFVQHK